jgi:RNA polymerase sigma-70 factor (ECF subfamily)
MPGREKSGEARTRAVVYCVVPSELADKLHEPLRRHFRDDRAVEVIVEQRGHERRRSAERRRAEEAAAEERRRIRAESGRRVGDRRAALVPVESPRALPRRVLPYADRLVFVELLEPSSLSAEDHDTGRLVVRFQAGDESVFNAIYMRYFDRVYAHLSVVLRDTYEAEDAAQEVFLRALRALPEYELRAAVPFRGWLFTIVRNHAQDVLRRRNRLELEEPARIDRRRERDHDEPNLSALDWVSDRELVMLIERLPLAQRQVLVLRYMVQLRNAEIASILGRTPESVRKLHERAIAFLEERLSALGRGSESRDRRPSMKGAFRQAIVVRRRRFAMLSR